MARRLLQEASRIGHPDTGPYGRILNGLTRDYEAGRGIPAGELVGRALAFRDRVASAGPFPTSCQIVRHPVRKRAIIETMRPGVVEGPEQQWLLCAGTVTDLTQDEVAVVEANPPVAISMHAVCRLFERGTFDAGQLCPLLETMTLWALPLLRVMYDTAAELGTELAMPFADGLLLGTLEAASLAPGQGPSLVTISRRGTSSQVLEPAFGRKGVGILQVAINTYVHNDELFESQSWLLRRLESFGAEFRTAMAALRAGLLRGFPDPIAGDRFPQDRHDLSATDLSALMADIHDFFASPEWRSHAEAHRRPARFMN